MIDEEIRCALGSCDCSAKLRAIRPAGRRPRMPPAGWTIYEQHTERKRHGQLALSRRVNHDSDDEDRAGDFAS